MLRALRQRPSFLPTAAEAGFRVTVCIAAMAEQSKALVMISDKRVSYSEFSAENLALKNEPFWSREWTVMYAGNDVTHVEPIRQHAVELLDAVWLKAAKPRQRHAWLPPKMFADALDAAFGWRLNQEIERQVLRPFGFSSETFRRQGKRLCTESQHAEICSRIAAVHLDGLVMLLCGFDRGGYAHIWTIDGVSAPKNYDSIGMFAVGSGAKAALSTLAFHSNAGHIRYRHSPVESVLYCALTAKFMAESATDVGRSTFPVILRGSHKTPQARQLQFLTELGVGIVREKWEKEGAPRFPAGFVSPEGIGQLIEE